MSKFKGKLITRDQILRELAKYDVNYPNTNDYESWLNEGTYSYALKYENKLYPPKYILSQITGLPLSEFTGGKETNQIFEQLGFAIRDKHNHIKYWKIAPGEKARFWERCVRDGNIAVGWKYAGNLTHLIGDFDSFKSYYHEVYKHEPATQRGRDVPQLWHFLTIPVGDIVVANKGISSLAGRGRVVGGYEYRNDYEEYKHVIPVQWFDTTERPVPAAAKDIAAPWFGLTLQEITEEQYQRLFSTAPISPDLALLTAKKQIILYGPPGTGKTFSTRQLSVDLIETIQVKKDINEEPEDSSDDAAINEEQYPEAVNSNFITIRKALNQLPNVTEEQIKKYLAFHFNKNRVVAWLPYPPPKRKRFRIYLMKKVKYPESLTNKMKDFNISSYEYPNFTIEDEHDTRLAIELIKYAYNAI